MSELPLRRGFLRPIATFAAVWTIQLVPAILYTAFPARASVEIDRKYALENIGFLKPWDNVDGLFTDYVTSAYRDYFAKQSRFVLIDLAKADTILNKSKLPYMKLIGDPEILSQIARSARAQTVLRTKISKDGPEYRFTLDWLHSPQMETIATDTVVLKEPEDGKGFGLEDIRAALQGSLDKMIHKVPFVATVTGRDNNSVTVNIGTGAGVAAGDLLVIDSLDEVKKHPLLKEIVDWRFSPVGKVQIEQVEEGLAFGRVMEEETGRQIARYQKVREIHKKPRPADPPIIYDKAEDAAKLGEMPALGFAGVSALLGGYSQNYGNTGGLNQNSGGSVMFGFKGEGQLWLTREWFGEMSMGFGFSSYNSALLFNFKIAAGYSYLASGDFYGPKGWVKLGYHGNSYHMPLDQSPVSLSAHSPFLGIGGELPLRDQYGAIVNLEFGLFPGASDGSGASVNGASDVYVFIGGYYRQSNRMTIRIGIDITANGANYADGSSVSEKEIAIAPGLLFYF